MTKDRLDKLEQKLDSIIEKLHETNVILAENTQSLIVHEKRTDLAEKKLQLVEERFNKQIEREAGLLNTIDTKLKPIQEYVNFLVFTVKYIVPSIAAVIVFLYKLDFFKFLD